MVVSSRVAAAADTRATATPLTKPSHPTRHVALRSPGGVLWEKNWEFLGQWLELWLGDPGQTLKNQAQLGVFCFTARFTQWWMP